MKFRISVALILGSALVLSEGVAGQIKHSVGSIGYVSHEFARRAGLKEALLENRAGKFIAPSEASSSAA